MSSRETALATNRGGYASSQELHPFRSVVQVRTNGRIAALLAQRGCSSCPCRKRRCLPDDDGLVRRLRRNARRIQNGFWPGWRAAPAAEGRQCCGERECATMTRLVFQICEETLPRTYELVRHRTACAALLSS